MDQPKIPAPITDAPDGMSVHIQYIRRDIDEIKLNLRDLKDNYVTNTDFQSHLKIDEDHEKRIRTLEDSVTKIVSMMKTWGIAGAVLLGGLQVIEIVYFLTHTK